MIRQLTSLYEQFLKSLTHIEGIAPLLLRVYLAPIMIMAGWGKITGIENTIAWFGNPDWGLGMPAPAFMAWAAALTEFLGGIALLLGFATRLVSIPLMFTMLVAAVTAHWGNGWHALPESQLTMPWEWRTDLIEEASQRKDIMISILREHGNYSWLTEAGSVTILKNGIEFAATYFVMLLALVFMGGGRYVSIDYYLGRNFGNPESPSDSN